MEAKKTQRIIGIVVLIALVIIVAPLFFGKSEGPTKIAITNPPPFPEQNSAKTTVMPVAAVIPEPKQENTPTVAPAIAQTVPPQAPPKSVAVPIALKKSSEKNLENFHKTAWVVQMGSFKNKNNARLLADKLRVAGYKAFTYKIKSAQGTTRTRVYVGPEFKQLSALKLSTKIAHDMKMTGFVVLYSPLEL